MGREKKNKPKRQRTPNEPPPNIVDIAAKYTCGHCDSNPAKIRQDQYGFWHLDVEHDDSCPVYRGTVRDDMDLARAAEGHRILRITE